MAIPQPEFIVIAQGQGPARAGYRMLGLDQTLSELLSAAAGNGSEQMGGEHEVERSVQFVIRQIGSGLLHRLNRLSQQEHITTMGIHPLPQSLEEGMGCWQPLAAGAF